MPIVLNRSLIQPPDWEEWAGKGFDESTLLSKRPYPEIYPPDLAGGGYTFDTPPTADSAPSRGRLTYEEARKLAASRDLTSPTSSYPRDYLSEVKAALAFSDAQEPSNRTLQTSFRPEYGASEDVEWPVGAKKEGLVLFGTPEGVGAFNPRETDVSKRIMRYIQSKTPAPPPPPPTPQEERAQWATSEISKIEAENQRGLQNYLKNKAETEKIFAFGAKWKRPISEIEAFLKVKGLEKLTEPKRKEIPEYLMKMLEEREKFTTPSAEKFTPESRRIYERTGQQSDLVPIEKEGEGVGGGGVTAAQRTGAENQINNIANFYNAAYGGSSQIFSGTNFIEELKKSPGKLDIMLKRMTDTKRPDGTPLTPEELQRNQEYLGRFLNAQDIIDKYLGYARPKVSSSQREIPEEPLARLNKPVSQMTPDERTSFLLNKYGGMSKGE